MPLPNPFPCMPLQTTTKVIAAVQALIGEIRFIISIVGIVRVLDLKHSLGHSYSSLLATLVIFAVIQVAIILAAIVLFKGASKGNANYLLIWLVFTGIVMCFEFWGIIRMDPGAFVSFFISFYFMWVVYAFRIEVMGNPGASVNPTPTSV